MPPPVEHVHHVGRLPFAVIHVEQRLFHALSFDFFLVKRMYGYRPLAPQCGRYP